MIMMEGKQGEETQSKQRKKNTRSEREMERNMIEEKEVNKGK